MIEIGPARECEVVLAFLRAEIDSERYGDTVRGCLQQLGVDRGGFLDNADLTNEQENTLRRLVLTHYRGFGNRAALFHGFPADVSWRRVELENHDLDRLMFANEPTWLTLSGGTRKPGQVAARIAKGDPCKDVAQRVKQIQEKLGRGEKLPELIAAVGKNDDLILIEGHSRATAYVGLNWGENIPTFLGSSPSMCQWYWY